MTQPARRLASCPYLLNNTMTETSGTVRCAHVYRQIIASASTAYSIPWPPSFKGFLSVLRVFLVDVVSITRTNCAQPMNYYGALVTVLVGVKLSLLLILAGPWLWRLMKRRGCCAHSTRRSLRQKVAGWVLHMRTVTSP